MQVPQTATLAMRGSSPRASPRAPSSRSSAAATPRNVTASAPAWRSIVCDQRRVSLALRSRSGRQGFGRCASHPQCPAITRAAPHAHASHRALRRHALEVTPSAQELHAVTVLRRCMQLPAPRRCTLQTPWPRFTMVRMCVRAWTCPQHPALKLCQPWQLPAPQPGP